MKYDRVQLRSADSAPASAIPALVVSSLGMGAVIGSFAGLASGSTRAGVITGVAVGAATAAALGLFLFVVKGATATP